VPNTTCSVCALNFSTRAYLVAHIQRRHGDRDVNKRRRCMSKRVHKCTLCASAFATPYGLRTHVHYVHEGYTGVHVCATCQAPFQSRSLLAIHTRKHTGERPYKCTTCDAAFTRVDHLRSHTRSQHIRVQAHVCTVCEKRFTELGSMRRHVNTVHLAKRAYACSVCDAHFGNAAHRRRHEQVMHEQM
jgi:KRAB domain-containing zinc finger protein